MRSSRLAVLLCLCSAASGRAQATPGAQVWVERETYLMGTPLHALVAAPSREEGFAAIEAAFGEVQRLDDLLSTWRGNSAVARLNAAAPGTPAVLPPELFLLLARAGSWVARTDGAFDPAIGALEDAWDMRGAGRRPDQVRLAAALAESGPGCFRFDSASSTATRRHAGCWLDTGGFGKGAALSAAWSALESLGVHAGSLNFGGQVEVFGTPPGGGRWPVPVAHPRRRDQTAATLALGGGSAATSSQSERFVQVGGERFGHVIDPRTGVPVPPWGSVTVVADDPTVADILSTALLVLGPEVGMRWVEGRADVGALFLIDRGAGVELRYNRRMADLLLTDSPASSNAR